MWVSPMVIQAGDGERLTTLVTIIFTIHGLVTIHLAMGIIPIVTTAEPHMDFTILTINGEETLITGEDTTISILTKDLLWFTTIQEVALMAMEVKTECMDREKLWVPTIQPKEGQIKFLQEAEVVW